MRSLRWIFKFWWCLSILLAVDALQAQCQFIRGDMNSSGDVDLADAVDILSYLYIGESVPACPEVADANDNGLVDLGDYVYLTRWMFGNGPQPPAPFPSAGTDPTPGSTVIAERDSRFKFTMGNAIGHASNTGLKVDLKLTNQAEINAFQMVFEYDGNLMRVDEILVGGTVLDNADAEYVIHQFFNQPGVSHGGLSVLIDFATPVNFRTLPPGEDQLVGKVVFAISAIADQQITTIRFVDGVKFPDSDPPEKLAAVHNLVHTGHEAHRPVLVDGFIDIRKAFIRGDANQDKGVDIGDAIFTLTYVFLGTEAPHCKDAADVNNDSRIDISDPIFLLQYLFRGGPQPSSPYPAPGVDPDQDPLGCL